jgi:foldase protein PrsA
MNRICTTPPRTIARSRMPRALVSLVLVLAGLSACGGSGHGSDGPSAAVVQIGNAVTTRANLDHWMASFAGGDFYEHHAGKRAPHGLVSDPPNYTRCVTAGKTIPPEYQGATATPTRAHIEELCHQLYTAIKEQTLSFLISVQWTVDEATELGIRLSNTELHDKLKRLIAEQFPAPGEFQTYLANHEWAESDELYQLKRNLLTDKIHERLAAGGTTIASERTYIDHVLSDVRKQKSETSCRPGYVVPSCKQSPAQTVGSGSSADALLEQL